MKSTSKQVKDVIGIGRGYLPLCWDNFNPIYPYGWDHLKSIYPYGWDH